ncbi:MAG TPA: hypothetical protein VKA70_01410 [Blastocatellia bacterium]|nr:hypothetical protein [Blastocatellia bacterium]
MTGDLYVTIIDVPFFLGIFGKGYVLLPIGCPPEYTDRFWQVNASTNVIMVIVLKIPQVRITRLPNAKITVVVVAVAEKEVVAVAAAGKNPLTAGVSIATAIMKRNMHGTTLRMGVATSIRERTDTVMVRSKMKVNGVTSVGGVMFPITRWYSYQAAWYI